jgi:glycosyltransferase involved in cell wall biosynthesis
VLEALAYTREPVKVRFAGAPDHPDFVKELSDLSLKLKLTSRVEWLGPISEEEKCDQYAHALGVLYPPIDEDYGYVTLEAMLSRKPLITCTDSGGPLEFVRPGEDGLVASPKPNSGAKRDANFMRVLTSPGPMSSAN